MRSPKRAPRPSVDVETIKRVFRYEPNTGLLFWKMTMGQRAQAGSLAGRVHSKGYVVVRFLGRGYFVHRIAYALMCGEWPSEQVDHRDRNKANNRWDNLRAATHGANRVNSIYGRKHDLPRGAHQIGDRFMAIAQHNKKRHYLGCFDNAEAAAEAYRQKILALHGDFLPR